MSPLPPATVPESSAGKLNFPVPEFPVPTPMPISIPSIPPSLSPIFAPEPDSDPDPDPNPHPEPHPHPHPQPHPQPQPLQQPTPTGISTRPETRPISEAPPFFISPLSPKSSTITTLGPPSSLPTSAVLPSSAPVPTPVSQSPNGGAMIPLSTESSTPLPILPGTTLSPPEAPLHGSINGVLTSISSSDHQNIKTTDGSNNVANGFIMGLAVGGILLLLLGTVFGLLFLYCKRRYNKKSHNLGSSRRNHATIFSDFQGKNSLPQYTKRGSNNTEVHHNDSMINVATSKGSNMAITTLTFVGPTPGNGPTFSSGKFTYNELMRATNGFSDENLIGQGGFGYVHKGVLPNGKEVAVKQLKIGGHQAEREFRAEVEIISQVHHKHLVSLIGYCIAGAERLLVYEFVPNNTLDFHLHGKKKPVMDWPTRLRIAIGSAKGLAYLHEDCSPTIIHRDIKAANILLNFNFEAKVSDFGLAKIFSSSNPTVTHITTRVIGTFGYLAPEYVSSGKVTDKTDVYSYGVMLLELITGRPPITSFESVTNGSLVNWARPLLAQAIGDGKFDTLADPRLKNDYNVDEMVTMIACAAACVRLSAWNRPRMSQVVRALEGNLPASDLDDGTRPGQNAMNLPNESLDFDARNYMEELKNMALTSNNVNDGYTSSSSRYSEDTSEYGLNSSASSTDFSDPSVLRL